MSNLVHQTRCNHALEHATIALLNRRHPKARVMGLSGPFGFTLYTTLTTEEIFPAVTEALKRLKQGQRSLAIHPQCGTNLLTAATLTTGTTLLSLGNFTEESTSERIDRILRTILLNALMLIAARPLGMWVQENVTVDPNVGNLDIAAIVANCQNGPKRIKIKTHYK